MKHASLAAVVLLTAFLFATSTVSAQRPSLGAAEDFAVLGASTVDNAGVTTVTGNLGVAPGTSITGFPPGVVVGDIHAGDALALQAQSDLTVAYGLLAGAACTTEMTGTDLGGLTLTPGVYCFAASATLNGALFLDAQGNPDALFIFQVGSTLLVELESSVQLINSAQANNVFWQVGSSATLAAGVSFQGNIVALASITMGVGTTVLGRALARTAAVSLNASEVATPTVIPPPGATFIRGDCNADGSVVFLADAIFLLTFSFSNGATPPCMDAADVNGDGSLGALIDPLFLLNYGFAGGPPPPSPSPNCGTGSSTLDCLQHPCS